MQKYSGNSWSITLFLKVKWRGERKGSSAHAVVGMDRAFDADGALALELSDEAGEFIFAFDLDDHFAAGGFFELENVAGGKVEEFVDFDGGVAKEAFDEQRCALEVFLDGFHVAVGGGFFGVGEPV